MADLKRDAGPRTIFSVFLGLMLTAFVGVGIYTFYPPPGRDDAQRTGTIHVTCCSHAGNRNDGIQAPPSITIIRTTNAAARRVGPGGRAGAATSRPKVAAKIAQGTVLA